MIEGKDRWKELLPGWYYTVKKVTSTVKDPKYHFRFIANCGWLSF